MSRASIGEHDVEPPGGLPRGTVSYADREWLAGQGEIRALSFAPDGRVLWAGDESAQIVGDSDPTLVAAGVLLHVAQEAAEAALAATRGAVEVIGAGLVAARVRQLVGDRSAASDPPGAVVDTTGDPAAIRSGLDRLSELGTIVLAGESSGRTLDLDLYASVHRRGLVVVGVAPPVQHIDDALTDVEGAEVAQWRSRLVDVSPGTWVPGDALWYRFGGERTA